MQKKRKLDIEFKEKDLKGMVGAWRLGKVIDVASQRKQGYSGGPIDTPFRVTLNVDISFLDWRALRRSLGVFSVANDFVPQLQWNNVILDHGPYKGLYNGDDGRVMQWPTMYYLNGHDDPSYSDQNIPVYIPNSDRKGKYRSLQLENQRTHYLSEIQIHHDKNKYNNDDDDLMKELHDYSTPLMGEFTKKSNELILRGEARTRTRSSIKSDMSM